jgi:hydrogenase maturation protein HypF
MRIGLRIEARGVVQGVGFRPWVSRLAREQGVTGRVRNDASGVTIDAFGEEQTIGAFLRRLASAPPPAADVREWRTSMIPEEDAGTFDIAQSTGGGDLRISIPADLATCPACLAEIFDPANRRYRYPFTNCTECGPRFTIAREAPYDRAATTMDVFEMCPACQREYDDVRDRRFHAQPNACPVCGPGLVLMTPQGDLDLDPDPIAAAASAIRAGLIVAVKGIGGFHLACDAANDAAVRRLRARKLRDEKPFAVMVRDLAGAERSSG